MKDYELTVNRYDFCYSGSELHAFTSAEVRKLRVEVAEPTGPSIQSQTSINGSLPLFVLAFFIKNLFWFIFLVIFTSVSQVCKIFYNSLEADIIHLRNRSLLLKMRAFLHFSFSLSGIRLCSLKMSCIWSYYFWWIMSRHEYRYSRKQGSWTCFWWQRNQSGGVPYLFWKHACWYSW